MCLRSRDAGKSSSENDDCTMKNSIRHVNLTVFALGFFCLFTLFIGNNGLMRIEEECLVRTRVGHSTKRIMKWKRERKKEQMCELHQ